MEGLLNRRLVVLCGYDSRHHNGHRRRSGASNSELPVGVWSVGDSEVERPETEESRRGYFSTRAGREARN